MNCSCYILLIMQSIARIPSNFGTLLNRCTPWYTIYDMWTTTWFGTKVPTAGSHFNKNCVCSALPYRNDWSLIVLKYIKLVGYSILMIYTKICNNKVWKLPWILLHMYVVSITSLFAQHDVDPKKPCWHWWCMCVYAHQNIYIRLMLVTLLCKGLLVFGKQM